MMEPRPARMNLESTLLVTDLYQLTMLHGYYSQGMADTATFELFVRDLPPSHESSTSSTFRP